MSPNRLPLPPASPRPRQVSPLLLLLAAFSHFFFKLFGREMIKRFTFFYLAISYLACRIQYLPICISPGKHFPTFPRISAFAFMNNRGINPDKGVFCLSHSFRTSSYTCSTSPLYICYVNCLLAVSKGS